MKTKLQILALAALAAFTIGCSSGSDTETTTPREHHGGRDPLDGRFGDAEYDVRRRDRLHKHGDDIRKLFVGYGVTEHHGRDGNVWRDVLGDVRRKRDDLRHGHGHGHIVRHVRRKRDDLGHGHNVPDRRGKHRRNERGRLERSEKRLAHSGEPS